MGEGTSCLTVTRSVGFAHEMKCKDNHLIQMVK